MAFPKGATKVTEKRITTAAKFCGKQGKPLAAVAKRLGISESATRRVLDHARERNVIERVGDDRHSVYKARG